MSEIKSVTSDFKCNNCKQAYSINIAFGSKKEYIRKIELTCSCGEEIMFIVKDADGTSN